MKRKYLTNLIDWMNFEDRKPLMVWGSRQVGKTYLIEELFAKEYYNGKYLRIDLSDDIDFVSYATKNSNLNKVLDYIEIHYDFRADKDHLLFFDEAQECPSIIKMMKHFCENRREIPVIVSGSMVRLRLNREKNKTGNGFLFPVGKMNQLYVYPMTFDEFLLNYNERKYKYVLKKYNEKSPIDENIHEELIDDFKNYMFVGGMPEAVDTFIKNKDERVQSFKKAQIKLKEIYDGYLNDMMLYQASTESIIRTRLIYSDIFKQLNKENKNFKISNIVEGAKNRDMVNPYFWLRESGVALESYCLKERVTLPLLKEGDALFRLYLSDVGMFTYQSGINYTTFLTNKENVLTGVYYENFVAQELTARGYELFYWKGKRNSELEFVININDDIVPIDIKKSRRSLDSLNEFRQHNSKRLSIKISKNQYGYDEKEMILTLPFYYLSFYLDDIKND